METLLQPSVVQGIGAIILLAALIQAAVATMGMLRRSAAANEQQARAVEVLRFRASAAQREVRNREERTQHGWDGIRKFEIANKVPEADGVHSFYLVPHDGKPLPPFNPGQFLTFSLRMPGAAKPVIRCYSLSDSPGKPHYRVSIKKVPPPRDKPDLPSGLSSTYFNDQLAAGDILDVKAPGGQFFLDETSPKPVVLIGGGIGITPVLSMLNTICESGSRRETWFFLGVRNSNEHVQKDYLERLAAEHLNVNLHICYSDPLGGDEHNVDYQHEGRVSVDLFKQVLPSNNYEFYICGPPPMMNSLTEALDEWGVPEADVNFEAFGPASVKKAPAAPKDGDATAAKAPTATVTFARSQKTVAWDGSHESLLDLAEANDIAMDCGCRAGNCGTCITALKSGDVSYLNEPGSPPENGSCLTCISVPKGDVTLDA